MVAFFPTALTAAWYIFALAALVAAIPSFEGVTSWSSIGNLVPGMSYLQGLGPAAAEGHPGQVPFYLSIGATRGEPPSVYTSKAQTLTYDPPLSSPQGNPGNVTMYRNRSPPLFYIHQNQLWHFHNESAIMPVNVHNLTSAAATDSSAGSDKQQPQLPLQLVVGTRPEGIPGGRWRWQGTMLFYENGAQDNQGLFYSCTDVNGLNGMFLFLQW